MDLRGSGSGDSCHRDDDCSIQRFNAVVIGLSALTLGVSARRGRNPGSPAWAKAPPPASTGRRAAPTLPIRAGPDAEGAREAPRQAPPPARGRQRRERLRSPPLGLSQLRLGPCQLRLGPRSSIGCSLLDLRQLRLGLRQRRLRVLVASLGRRDQLVCSPLVLRHSLLPPPGLPGRPRSEPGRPRASPRIAIAPRRRARPLARLGTREPRRSSPVSWLSHSRARPVVAPSALELTRGVSPAGLGPPREGRSARSRGRRSASPP